MVEVEDPENPGARKRVPKMNWTYKETKAPPGCEKVDEKTGQLVDVTECDRYKSDDPPRKLDENGKLFSGPLHSYDEYVATNPEEVYPAFLSKA